MSRSPNPLRQLVHRLSSILLLVLQFGKKLLLHNRTIVRQCLQHLLQLFLWAKRNGRLLKGPLDGKRSYATKDGVGASLTYAKETSLSGPHSVGHRDPEENKYETCSLHLSYLRTPSPTPGIVGATDGIACLVDPSSSQLSLQGHTKDSQIPDEPKQDISSSPDLQDILLLPDCQRRSLERPTLRPFVPEMLGRYERNVKL